MQRIGAEVWLPYHVGHRKAGDVALYCSDSLTFSALLNGYAYLRRLERMAHALFVLSQHRLSRR